MICIVLPVIVAFHRGKSLMSLRALIISEMQKVAAEKGKISPPLTDDLSLFETGLDSLCYAILVARLEDHVGVDPLSSPGAVFPTSVGEFIALYEQSEKQSTHRVGFV
jgi:acyl carrier protein